jgi:hypothetical protein
MSTLLYRGCQKYQKIPRIGTLFEIKRNYSETGKILSYCELDTLMKTRMNLEGNYNYHLLPAKVAPT